MMADLTIKRKLLYNQDLMLPEKILLSLILAAGDDGLPFSTRYLTRAMNVSSSKCQVIISGLVKSGYIDDSQASAPIGVMVMRSLRIGPATEAIFVERTVNTGGTDGEYIPTSSFENLVEGIKKGEIEA